MVVKIVIVDYNTYNIEPHEGTKLKTFLWFSLVVEVVYSINAIFNTVVTNMSQLYCCICSYE